MSTKIEKVKRAAVVTASAVGYGAACYAGAIVGAKVGAVVGAFTLGVAGAMAAPALAGNAVEYVQRKWRNSHV